MRISHRWKQEKTANRKGRSYPLRCPTAHDDRRIVCTAVMDHAATSRTVAQQIQSVTHHSVSVRTIRRRLQPSGMSTRRPLLRLPVTGNHRCLRRQWGDERWTWTTEWNNILCLLTNSDFACKITMVGFEFLETPWGEAAELLRSAASLVLHPVSWFGLYN
ncbi:transposable element Tcb1 transposase [Trichonephila clavipes]|nr:transposable element Tcb1 transposase [Trichonephila clavipes]